MGAQVIQGTRQILQQRRVALRQLLLNAHSLFRWLQRLLAPAQIAISLAQVVQGHS